MDKVSPYLDRLIDSLCDFEVVDWDEAFRRVQDREEARLVQALRTFARVSEANSSLAATPDRTSGPVPDVPSLSPGSLWGHLEIVGRIGQGSSAEVYHARDTKLDRDVALKLYYPWYLDDPEQGRALVDEGRLLARIKHPNVVTVYGADEQEGRLGLWMELIRGRTLSRIVQEQGRLGEREGVLVALDCCKALSAMHREGILHRDIAAQNVVREEGGRIVVMDFGIGVEQQLESRQSFAGTPLYLAPELFAGSRPTVLSDLYSLGVLLYHLLTAAFPARGSSFGEIARDVREGRLAGLRDARSGLSEPFLRVMDRALEADPSKRYSSAGDFQRELGRLLDATPHEPPQVSGRGKRLRWAALAAGLSGIAVLTAFATLDPGARSGAGNGAGEKPSVAVLMFQNGNRSLELDWLRIGLAELVVSELASSAELNVLWSESFYRLLDAASGTPSNEEMERAARALGAGYIVRGSYYRLERTFRVSVQVQDVHSGRLIAGQVFEGSGDSSLFRLADEVSDHVRMELSSLRRAGMEGGSPAAPMKNMDTELNAVSTVSIEAFRSYARALEEQYRGRRPEAISLLENAVSLDPRFTVALGKLAILNMHEGRDQTGYAYSERALANADRASPVEKHYVEGNHFSWHEVTYEKAIASYREALAWNPDYWPARRNLTTLLVQLERYEEALTELERLERAAPHFASVWELLATSAAARGDFDEANRTIAKLLSQSKADPDYALRMKGHYLVFQGEGANAMASYREAEALSRDRRGVPADLWKPLVLQESWTELDRWLRDRSARSPEDWLHRGIVLSYLGRSAEALEAFREAGRASPEPGRFSAAVHTYAAELLLETGRAAESLRESELAIRDGYGDFREWEGLFLKAVAHASASEWTQADEALEKLTRSGSVVKSPRTPRCEFHLSGRLALARGDVPLSIESLSQAEELLSPRGVSWSLLRRPDHVPIWYALAEAHLAAGDQQAAREYLELIVESASERLLWPVPYVRSLFLLGKVKESMGEAAEARTWYQRFVRAWERGDFDRAWILEAKSRL